jgi:hypothetical protein
VVGSIRRVRKGLQRRLLAAVGPWFMPGERPVLGTCAALGSDLFRTTTTTAVQTSLQSRGRGFTLAVPKRFFLLLTTHRLLFVAANQNSGRPLPSVVAALPRHGLRMAPAAGGMWKAVQLVGPGGEVVAQLNFAVPQRKDGDQLAAVLNAG